MLYCCNYLLLFTNKIIQVSGLSFRSPRPPRVCNIVNNRKTDRLERHMLHVFSLDHCQTQQGQMCHGLSQKLDHMAYPVADWRKVVDVVRFLRARRIIAGIRVLLHMGIRSDHCHRMFYMGWVHFSVFQLMRF